MPCESTISCSSGSPVQWQAGVMLNCTMQQTKDCEHWPSGQCTCGPSGASYKGRVYVYIHSHPGSSRKDVSWLQFFKSDQTVVVVKDGNHSKRIPKKSQHATLWLTANNFSDKGINIKV
jgi:hypothetical protein